MLELKEALCTEVFLCEKALCTGKALGFDASECVAVEERMQRLSAGASASASACARAGAGTGAGAGVIA